MLKNNDSLREKLQFSTRHRRYFGFCEIPEKFPRQKFSDLPPPLQDWAAIEIYKFCRPRITNLVVSCTISTQKQQ